MFCNPPGFAGTGFNGVAEFYHCREMIQKGNWLIPTMNNELRLAKQPMVTWFTAVSAIAGNSITSPFILRIPATIIATLMVLFFYGLCFEFTGRSDFAFMGSTIFATSLLVVQMARVNSWDIYTHAFMTGSLWLQVKAFNRLKNNLIWLAAGLLMGLSVFSKGPVGLYALWLPFLVSYYFFNKKEHIRRNAKKMLGMLLLALVTGLAWHGYLYLKLHNELIEILSTETVSRGTRHIRPFYFYFHFPVYIGIWALPMLAALFLKPMRQRIAEMGNYGFLLCWLLLGLLLLSVIPEKKERYMLPLEIPMSLMVSYLFYSIYQQYKTGMTKVPDRALILVQGFLMVLLMVSLPVIGFLTLKNDFLKPLYLIATCISLIAVLFLIRELFRPEKLSCLKTVFVSSIGVVFLITLFYLPILPYKIYNQDFRDIATLNQRQEYNNAEFISAGEINMQLVWRIGRPVLQIDDLPHFQFRNRTKYFLFSYTPVETVLSAQQLEQSKITNLGEYNCNQDKGNCKIYVNIVEEKI
jgi:4-amino-4-deoxy-L-arabinose transferase-like glycosyltransferase